MIDKLDYWKCNILSVHSLRLAYTNHVIYDHWQWVAQQNQHYFNCQIWDTACKVPSAKNALYVVFTQGLSVCGLQLRLFCMWTSAKVFFVCGFKKRVLFCVVFSKGWLVCGLQQRSTCAWSSVKVNLWVVF